MRAFVKQELWDRFKEISNKYGFYLDVKKPKLYITKVID